MGGQCIPYGILAYPKQIPKKPMLSRLYESPGHLTALAGNEGGHKGREKRKKGKGKGRLSASPAYAGEVGGIGDDSGVFVSRKQGSDLKRPA